MANVVIDDSNLHAIGDALRSKLGESHTEKVLVETIHHPETTRDMAPKIAKTSNAISFTEFNGAYDNSLNDTQTIKIDGATSLLVDFACQTEGVSYDYLTIGDSSVKYGGSTLTRTSVTIVGDTVQFMFHSDGSSGNYLGYYAEVYGLDADGNILQEIIPAWDEEITEEVVVPRVYKPRDMAAAIESIEAGGGGGGETNNKFAVVETPTTAMMSECTGDGYVYMPNAGTADGNKLYVVLTMHPKDTSIGTTTFTGIDSTQVITARIQSKQTCNVIPEAAITGNMPRIYYRTGTTSTGAYMQSVLIPISNIDATDYHLEALVGTRQNADNYATANVVFNSDYKDYKKIIIIGRGGFTYGNGNNINNEDIYPESDWFEKHPVVTTMNAYSTSYFYELGVAVFMQKEESTLGSAKIHLSTRTGLHCAAYVLYYKTPEEV